MTEQISGVSFTFFLTDLTTSMLKYWTLLSILGMQIQTQNAILTDRFNLPFS